MPRWKVSFDETRRVHRHQLPRSFGHALLSPTFATVFRTLRVSASLTDGNFWWPLHVEPNTLQFETEHGAQAARYAYNARCMAQARRSKALVRGEHAGGFDLFVPVVAAGTVEALLITGPFIRTRPTGAEILARWRALTGLQGHPADPQFAAYLSATLSQPVLDAELLSTLERLLGCFVALMAAEKPAAALMNEAELLHLKLWEARHIERTWDAVQSMVDDRFARTWHSVDQSDPLRILGLSRVPDQVLVGLTVSRAPALEPVDEAIRRDAFQRSAVQLARSLGGVVAGRVGEHGVVLLAAPNGSPQRRQQKLREISDRASALAERSFRLSLHFGGSATTETSPLSRSYQAALAAAESALTLGVRIVLAEPGQNPPLQSLRHLRRALIPSVKTRPDELPARFDRYLEGVAVQCGYRIDLVRAHLDVGFERLAEVLVDRGTLDEKSLRQLCDALDRAAAGAPTLSALFAAYRRAVTDLAAAVQRPLAARHDRSLRSALDHIQQHYGEPLSLATVAAIAGFAPNYFSKLFIERERMRFGDYLRSVRLERARQLLADTELDVTRVAELTGFTSIQYFCRAFQRAFSQTPLAYRDAAAKSANIGKVQR